MTAASTWTCGSAAGRFFKAPYPHPTEPGVLQLDAKLDEVAMQRAIDSALHRNRVEPRRN